MRSRFSVEEYESPKLSFEKQCTEFDQILHYEKTYLRIGKRRKHELSEITGCQVPCQYMDYKIVDSMVDRPTSMSQIKMLFASDEITVETEEFVYDLVSFIAECGGALGLFLGFSFFMIWDLLASFKSVILQIIK